MRPSTYRIFPNCFLSLVRLIAKRILPGLLLYMLGLGLLLTPCNVGAEFYRYTDENGKNHYVDDFWKIPERYRVQIKKYREKYDGLLEEERLLLIQEEEKAIRERKAAEKEQRERIAREKFLKSLQTEVIIKNNRVLVPVTLGYRGFETETHLVLDTGASVVALYQEIADKLYIEEFKKAKIRVFGGSTIDTKIASLDFVQVGPIRRENIRIGIIDPGGSVTLHKGLLGMNFLRDLEYRVDFENEQIHWTPTPDMMKKRGLSGLFKEKTVGE